MLSADLETGNLSLEVCDGPGSDLRVGEIQYLQIGELGKMNQTRVGDLRAGEIQFLQIAKIGQMNQTLVSD